MSDIEAPDESRLVDEAIVFLDSVGQGKMADAVMALWRRSESLKADWIHCDCGARKSPTDACPVCDAEAVAPCICREYTRLHVRGELMSDTSVLRQDYDPTRPAYIRKGEDATKVPCPRCDHIHWIGDCGEKCARRYSDRTECGLPEHTHPENVATPHPFSRPICTCTIGSSAGRKSCPRHWKGAGNE